MGILQKPFMTEELLAAIRVATRQRGERQASFGPPYPSKAASQSKRTKSRFNSASALGRSQSRRATGLGHINFATRAHRWRAAGAT